MFTAGDMIEGRYRVFNVKQGGMGVVFLCDDLAWVKAGRPLKVALKSLLPSICRRPGAVDRFLNEARLWVELGKHANILHAHYVKKIGDLPFICMEFISGAPGYGPDLESWIESKTLTVEQSLHFAVQFCNGMIYAENCFAQKGLRFVHRDIKPGNTMINGAFQVKITDFGLAKAADDPASERVAPAASETITGSVKLTMDGAVLGTPRYMSPEQCRGSSQLDLRSDIYSFGCMLFEMLTGRPPFIASTVKELLNQHKNETPPSPSSLVGGLPLRLNHTVLQCLQKDPKDRYADFSALRRDLAENYKKVSGKHPPEAETGLGRPGTAGVGDKLNKSMSLFELGQKSEGVRLFAEAIGEQGKEKTPTARPPASPAAAGKTSTAHLVKGGLVIPDKPPPVAASPERPGFPRQKFPTHEADRETRPIPERLPTHVEGREAGSLPSRQRMPTHLDENGRKTVAPGAVSAKPSPKPVQDDKKILVPKPGSDRPIKR